MDAALAIEQQAVPVEAHRGRAGRTTATVATAHDHLCPGDKPVPARLALDAGYLASDRCIAITSATGLLHNAPKAGGMLLSRQVVLPGREIAASAPAVQA